MTEIVQAGLLLASGDAGLAGGSIVVRDKEMLLKLSECRAGAAKMLANAAAAIVVIGDSELSDTWIEDCSIVLSNMHLMADSLGVGSCWIQGRLRRTPEEETTEEYVRRCLGFPEKLRLEAILSPWNAGSPRGGDGVFCPANGKGTRREVLRGGAPRSFRGLPQGQGVERPVSGCFSFLRKCTKPRTAFAGGAFAVWKSCWDYA